MLAVKHIGAAQRNHASQLIAYSPLGSVKKKKSFKKGFLKSLFGGDKQQQPDLDEEKGQPQPDLGALDDPLMAKSALFSSFETMTAGNCLLHKDTFCGILKLMMSTLNRYGDLLHDTYLSIICSNTLCD